MRRKREKKEKPVYYLIIVHDTAYPLFDEFILFSFPPVFL